MSPLDFYFEYLERICPTIVREDLEKSICNSIQTMDWDNPESSLELNNFAVIALIEAENVEDLDERQMLLNVALEALNAGIEQDQNPLCRAHLALVLHLTGDSEGVEEIGYNTLLQCLQPAYYEAEIENVDQAPLGLIYLPPFFDRASREATLNDLFLVATASKQALLFTAKTLSVIQPIFYSLRGLRWLEIACDLFPEAPRSQFSYGLALLCNQRHEGLLHLHHAQKFEPATPNILQALSLGYRDLGHLKTSDRWQTIARACRLPHQQLDAEWRWTELDSESTLTYLAYDGLVLSVEPSFNSIVTTVLLAQGDWFEREMEFWRTWIKPGMTVIDVGANAGVYTFSAAKRVGQTGRVIAIEPFSQCVNYLEETKRINNFDWVTVHAAAASSKAGIAYLQLCRSNELNEVVFSQQGLEAPTEMVKCLTLDDLMFAETLKRVDFLKLDAEGHELEILAGSHQLLSVFHPTILYENIAAGSGSNLPVANCLRALGYKLFRYQPYIRQLLPLESNDDLQGQLNAIAIHHTKLNTVLSLGNADVDITDEAALSELLISSSL